MKKYFVNRESCIRFSVIVDFRGGSFSFAAASMEQLRKLIEDYVGVSVKCGEDWVGY